MATFIKGNAIENAVGYQLFKKVDENYKTSDDKIYAIGDVAGVKQTVAWAARSGFECAKQIYSLT